MALLVSGSGLADNQPRPRARPPDGLTASGGNRSRSANNVVGRLIRHATRHRSARLHRGLHEDSDAIAESDQARTASAIVVTSAIAPTPTSPQASRLLWGGMRIRFGASSAKCSAAVSRLQSGGTE